MVSRASLTGFFFCCRGGKARTGVRVHADDGGGGAGHDESAGHSDPQDRLQHPDRALPTVPSTDPAQSGGHLGGHV